MISITRKIDCCGCQACAQICHKQAIKMFNDEEGFGYPYVDKELCVNCGLCERVCPIINDSERHEVVESYAFQSKNDFIRKISTAGGAFYSIASEIIKQNGLVYGAAFDSNITVHHQKASTLEELIPLCMSKYVQSDINNTFQEIKTNLDIGKTVLFCGTPCQCEALSCFLKNKYEKLFLVDFLCHGVPSPKVWKRYVQEMQKRYGAYDFEFRSKSFGYNKSGMEFKCLNGEIMHGEISDKLDVQFMTKCFFSEIVSRPACHACRFKNIERVTDITLGDLWHICKYNPHMDDNCGTSFISVHTDNGRNIIRLIENNSNIIKINLNEYLKDDGINMISSMSANSRRSDFFNEFDDLSFEELFEKYLRTEKNQIKETLKFILDKAGVLHIVKRLRYKSKQVRFEIKNRK